MAANRDVTGFSDLRIAGAQSGSTSIESFTYAPVGGKFITVVLTAGRLPQTADEITLAPTTAKKLHAGIGSVIWLSGGTRQKMTVSGIGFVPVGPHNDYDQGAWLTPAGFDQLFRGSHYAFKFHAAIVTVRPGVNLDAATKSVNAAAAGVKGGAAFPFDPPGPASALGTLEDLRVLPTALAAFLALLAVGAVGYALTTAVRRRGQELAVLRALGLTSRQVRLVIITQGTLLAVAGLAAGIPLGLVVGRLVWRIVAGFTPLAYQPPLAPWALILIAPATLLAAILLTVWPGWRAARLRASQVLRTE